MDFADWDYCSSEAFLYRAVEKSKANKKCSPWGAQATAFKRRVSDSEGISLFLTPEMCWTLDIGTVVRLQVRTINSICNSLNGQPLTAIQDSPEHALIANVPRFGSDEACVNDTALQLAMLSEPLDASEHERAKQAGLEIRRQRAHVATQQLPRENPPESAL
jgi:hypothetical protein